jgi:hypothetical protein
MKNINHLLIAACAWLLVGLAADVWADGFDQLHTGTKPEPLEKGAGGFVSVDGGNDWIFLMHGGLPSELNARPVKDLWTLDGSDWVSVPSSAPARYGHSIVAAGQGQALGFGGCDANDELVGLGSVLSYQVQRRDSGIEVQIEEIAVPGENPGTCSGPPVVRIENRDAMLLIGGMCDYYPGRAADVWEYQISANRWQRRADLPQALTNHSAVVFDGQVWVFGGKDADGLSNRVFRYEVAQDSWSEVSTHGDRPDPMRSHRSVVVGETMVVFGGIREPFFPEAIDEVWQLDLGSLEWSTASDLPYPLAEMVATSIPEGFEIGSGAQTLLFGGVKDPWSFPRELSDVTWLYSTEASAVSDLIAIPAIARIEGRGAYFSSTLHLMNLGSYEMEMDLTFAPRADSDDLQPITARHSIAPGVMDVIDDPLASVFGFEDGEQGVGSLLIEVTSGASADLLAQTLVTATGDSGEEYGTYFPATRRAQALGAAEVGLLTTTDDPSSYRVNVGLMAMQEASSVRVTPLSRIGVALAPSQTYDLDRGDNLQINDIHDFFGFGGVADVMLEVAVDSGAVVAFATVLDGSGSSQGTSDPTTLQPLEHGSQQVTLLEIGSIQGIDDFSGSATIVNHSDFYADIRIDFCERDQPGVSRSEVIRLEAGRALGFGDLVREIFGIADAVGTAVLEATNGARISATGREYAIVRDSESGDTIGTAGTALPGLTAADLIDPDRTWHVIGLRQQMSGDIRERSHVAIFNPGNEIAEVELSLFNGADGAAEGSRSWAVEPGELIHVNNLMKKINDQVDGREKRIEISVSREVFLHAFRVNSWGDSVTLLAYSN